MDNLKVKINYLYHSGFAVETKNYFLIFDYYKDTPRGNKRSINHGVLSKEDFDSRKNVFVFVSHGHKDHYNPIIFKWQKFNSQIHYILSDDINIHVHKDNYHYIAPHERIKKENINIKGYGSTDIGVSFLIKADNITIFHAGDLNWWNWKGYTNEEKYEAKKSFKKEINKLAGEEIDIAFFPVDPRLEENYYCGGKYFIEQIKPKMFIPIHFKDKAYITKKFEEEMQNKDVEIVSLSYRGQEILYKKNNKL